MILSPGTIIFREATQRDALAIAHLHAESWRSAYRGMLSDEYLDNHAHADRAAVWQTRFAEKENNPFFVILAEIENHLAGFACTFPNEHPTYGSFLDNLHVTPASIGQGIGRQLLRETARRLLADQTPGGLYLWVIEQNARARRFYAKAGATEVERAELTMADATPIIELRCHWPNPATLLQP
jgi:hypothetical protein